MKGKIFKDFLQYFPELEVVAEPQKMNHNYSYLW